MPRREKNENHDWTISPPSLPVPEHLTEEARNEYERIGRYLLALGRVSELDYHPLANYCLSWAAFSRIMKEELADPWIPLYEPGPKGEVAHTLINPLLKYAKTLIHAAERFGMTARTRSLEGVARQAKSTAIKKLLGNQRKVATSKLERSVIPFIDGWEQADIEPPDWMSTRAKTEYQKLGKSLENLDLFTPLDRGPLVVGCCLFDLTLRCSDQLKDLYTHFYDAEGNEFSKSHPLHSVMYEIFKVADIVWKDYGQSPMYRKVLGGERKSHREVPMIFKGKFA